MCASRRGAARDRASTDALAARRAGQWWKHEQSQWNEPPCGPLAQRAAGLAHRELPRNPTVERYGAAAAERTHERGHFGDRQSERNLRGRITESVEAGHGDEEAPVTHLPNGDAAVAVREVDDGRGRAEERRHFPVAGQQRRVRLKGVRQVSVRTDG